MRSGPAAPRQRRRIAASAIPVSGSWLVHVPECGGLDVVDRLSDARGAATDLVTDRLDLPTDVFEITLLPRFAYQSPANANTARIRRIQETLFTTTAPSHAFEVLCEGGEFISLSAARLPIPLPESLIFLSVESVILDSRTLERLPVTSPVANEIADAVLGPAAVHFHPTTTDDGTALLTAYVTSPAAP